MNFIPLTAYFLIALFASFLCSLLEAVILSVTRSHIQTMIRKGKASGQVLDGLKSNVDRSLAAILTLNTLAHTGGAAGVGAETAKLARAANVPEDFWVGIAAVVVTIAILVFSEIIPKTLGAAYWQKIAGPAAYVIRFLIISMYPAVLALEVISRLFSKHGYTEVVTREEMLAMAQLGRAGGTIKHREGQVITNLFALQSLKASDVMTPRVEVFTLREDMTVSEVVDKHGRLRFSRIPITGEDRDDIKGMVLRYRIFEELVRGRSDATIKSLAVDAHFVPETKTIASLLDDFLRRNEHLFVVVDEFGGFDGIVTLEDVIETLLGVEIVDELDTVEDLRKLALTKLEARKHRLQMTDLDES
ncbi:MAG: hemolysin family protein [Planctomycetota bacterium]